MTATATITLFGFDGSLDRTALRLILIDYEIDRRAGGGGGALRGVLFENHAAHLVSLEPIRTRPTWNPASSSALRAFDILRPVTLGTVVAGDPEDSTSETELPACAGAPAGGSVWTTEPAGMVVLAVVFCGPTCKPAAASWRSASSPRAPIRLGTCPVATSEATITCTPVPRGACVPGRGFCATMAPGMTFGSGALARQRQDELARREQLARLIRLDPEHRRHLDRRARVGLTGTRTERPAILEQAQASETRMVVMNEVRTAAGTGDLGGGAYW